MIKYFTIEDLLKHYLQKKFHILIYAGNRTCQIYFKRKISQFRVQAIKNCRLNPDPTIEPTFHKIYFSIASAAPSWRFDDVT